MKDLFETILINEERMARKQKRRFKNREELLLEGETLYDAMGGSYQDRGFFDVDSAVAAGTQSGRGESLEDFDTLDEDGFGEDW